MNEEMNWKGPEKLRSLLVPIATLHCHPKNPRRGQVALIRSSLKRFGQLRPILHDENREIIAGNHTFLGAQEEGWTHIAAVPNDFGSREEAGAYLIADNRIPELGTYETDQLLPLLEELEHADGWAGTGYSPDDLEDLRALQGRIAETEQQDFTGDFAATAEELAARAAALQGGRSLSEIILLLTNDQNIEFERHVKILGKQQGSSGVTETVLQAVVAAFDRDA